MATKIPFEHCARLAYLSLNTDALWHDLSREAKRPVSECVSAVNAYCAFQRKLGNDPRETSLAWSNYKIKGRRSPPW